MSNLKVANDHVGSRGKIKKNAKIIKEFTFSYYFLSNNCSSPIYYKGIQYPTLEHAFISEKNDSLEWKERCSINCSPAEIKRIGRTEVILREDWEKVKIGIMEELLKIKFSAPGMKIKLLETEDMSLYNGNKIGEKFWGCDIYTLKGENHLGKLLMEIRKNL